MMAGRNKETNPINAVLFEALKDDKLSPSERIRRVKLSIDSLSKLDEVYQQFQQNLSNKCITPHFNINLVEGVYWQYDEYHAPGYSFGDTPLMVAAKNGHLDSVRMLLDANADVNIGYASHNALYFAIVANHRECAQMLIAANAEIYKGIATDILHLGRVEYLPMLIEAKADINNNFRIKTPLAIAAEKGYLPSIQLLIDAKANPNLPAYRKFEDDLGKSPLFYATRKQQQGSVRKLLEAKANPDRDALVQAVTENQMLITQMLLEAKANPDCQILDVAIRNDQRSLIKVLISAGAPVSKEYQEKTQKIGLDYELKEEFIQAAKHYEKEMQTGDIFAAGSLVNLMKKLNIDSIPKPKNWLQKSTPLLILGRSFYEYVLTQPLNIYLSSEQWCLLALTARGEKNAFESLIQASSFSLYAAKMAKEKAITAEEINEAEDIYQHVLRMKNRLFEKKEQLGDSNLSVQENFTTSLLSTPSLTRTNHGKEKIKTEVASPLPSIPYSSLEHKDEKLVDNNKSREPLMLPVSINTIQYTQSESQKDKKKNKLPSADLRVERRSIQKLGQNEEQKSKLIRSFLIKVTEADYNLLNEMQKIQLNDLLLPVSEKLKKFELLVLHQIYFEQDSYILIEKTDSIILQLDKNNLNSISFRLNKTDFDDCRVSKHLAKDQKQAYGDNLKSHKRVYIADRIRANILTVCISFLDHFAEMIIRTIDNQQDINEHQQVLELACVLLEDQGYRESLIETILAQITKNDSACDRREIEKFVYEDNERYAYRLRQSILEAIELQKSKKMEPSAQAIPADRPDRQTNNIITAKQRPEITQVPEYKSETSELPLIPVSKLCLLANTPAIVTASKLSITKSVEGQEKKINSLQASSLDSSDRSVSKALNKKNVEVVDDQKYSDVDSLNTHQHHGSAEEQKKQSEDPESPLESISQAKRDLLSYINKRNGDKEKETIFGYFTIFGALTGMSRNVKISAATKMLCLLSGEKKDETGKDISFTDRELDALRNSNLGKIIFNMESEKILPKEFIHAENIITLRYLRSMR